jgi:hypothetical protein
MPKVADELDLTTVENLPKHELTDLAGPTMGYPGTADTGDSFRPSFTDG